jgi:hypothetical protein
MRGYYRGLQTSILANMLSYGIFFQCYGALSVLLRTLRGGGDALESKDIMLITLLSGWICSIISNPIYLINTRISLATAPGQGMMDTARRIYREEGGLKGFTKGLLPNLVLVVNPVIYFVLYEHAKSLVFHHWGSHTASSLFIISSLSKTCATFATYPILTIRVRLQLQGTKNDAGGLASSLTQLRQVLSELDALQDLYAGFRAKFAHTVLYSSTMMVTYEGLKLLLPPLIR